MKARFLSMAAALLAGSMLVTGAFAEEGKTKLRLRHRWKAGEVMTRSESGTETEHQVVKTHDGNVVQDESAEKTTSYTLVEKCIEADADGHSTKSVVFVETWSLAKKGAEEDKSLGGKRVEITGTGKARAYKLVPDAPLTDDAKKWLDNHCGSESAQDEILTALEPAAEMAVGDTSAVDLKKLAAVLDEKIVIDTEKSEATLKLDALDGTTASIGLALSLAVKTIKNNGQEIPVEPGGKITIKSKVKAPADAGAGEGSNKDVFEMACTLKTPQVVVTIENKKSSEETMKPGGTIPEEGK